MLKKVNENDYKFVSCSDIAVFEMTREINCCNETLESCLQILSNDIINIHTMLKTMNLTKDIIFYARSQSFKQPNVIIKKKGGMGKHWFNMDR